MPIANIANAGNAPKVTDEHFVAVYNPTDGTIVHLHTVRVFEGAKHVSQAQAEQEALEAARARGHNVGELETAHTKQLARHGRHRIDLETMSFVPLEEPTRKRA